MLDYDFERLAEEHIQDWGNHYLGMTRAEIITDLSVNYDWSIELLNEQVPDADVEKFQYEFTKEVLSQLGYEMSDRNKHRLEWCIANTSGEVKEELEKLYSDLVY